MKSSVVKRSIVVRGHKTSVSLEDAFWQSLKDIARSRSMNMSDMVAAIDDRRNGGNLSSNIRLFVLECVRAQYAASAAQRTARPGERHDGEQNAANVLPNAR